MKARLLTAIVILFATSGSLLGFQVSRQFNVSPGGELSIQARQADIVIRLQAGNVLSLRASGVAEDELQVTQNGNLIQIVQSSQGSRWRSATLEVVAPVRFDLNLETGAGDIRIDGDLEGMLKVNTRGGDVSFRDVQGEADIQSSGGDISGGDIAGDSVVRTLGGDVQLGSAGGALEVSTHGGDIRIERVASSLKARTMGGDVRVGDVDAEAELSTMGGDIAVGRVSAWASLDTKGGDIELAGASGEVQAKTAGGDISLESISGSISAETAGGDIAAELAPQGSKGSRLSSKGGDITLYLQPGVGVTVEARIHIRGGWKSRSGEYRIISDFPATTSNRDAKTGEITGTYRINGGGPTIELETVNGDIQIRSR